MTAATDADARRDLELLSGYRRLAGVLGIVLCERGLDEVLAAVARALRGLVPCDDVVVWEARRDVLRAMFAEGGDAEMLRELRVRFGEGLTGLAAETHEPVLANAAHLDPRARLVPGTEQVPEAIICVPLVVRDELLGVLSLYRTGAEPLFTEQEFELSRHFGDVAAIAIDNARTRRELELLATTDDLTGIANRRRFRQELEREQAEAGRYGRPLSLLLLDLDGFKGVNDNFGHDLGDEVLKTVAVLLARRARQSDLVARVGGDEFALLLPQTGADEAAALAERLQEAITGTVGDLGVRASVGTASFPDVPPHSLLAEADRRLYASKRAAAEHGLAAPGSR